MSTELDDLTAGGRVPVIIEAAGEAAVASYLTFFNESGFSKSTCKIYESSLRRFFLWAEGRGLRLESIKGNEVAAYASEVRARSSVETAYVSLTPVRGLFRHFVRQGVLARDPCQTVAIESRNPKKIAATRKQGRPPKASPIAEASSPIYNTTEVSTQQSNKDFDFTGLSLDERTHLAHQLLKSIHDEVESQPLTAGLCAEVERRIVEADAGRIQSFPWTEAKHRLKSRR